MAPSTRLSTLITALLLLSRPSVADDFADLDSCSKSCIPDSKCQESDTACVCDAASKGYLTKLVDCLDVDCDHKVDANSQITAIDADCRQAGKPIDSGAVLDAQAYVGTNVIVSSDDSTHTLTSVPKYEKTTLSILTTETTVITSDFKTTDSNGNDVKTTTTFTSESTDTIQSVSTIATSYVTVTYTVGGGAVSVVSISDFYLRRTE